MNLSKVIKGGDKLNIKICAAQMEILPLNIEENLKKAELLIKQAYNEECDTICFPELFLTGPLGKENLKYAEEIPGPHTAKFCKLASEYGLHIIAGTIVERAGTTHYNTSTLINDSGEILGKYRKIKLWNGEKKYLDAGDKIFIFKTKFGKIGLEICWDLAFPEITKQMAMEGAKIIFSPSFWLFRSKYDNLQSENDKKRVPNIDTESIFIDACVPARAIENEIVFVYSNGCGSFEDDRFIGHTQIAVPFYGTVALAEDDEKLVIKDTDIDLTSLAEKVYEIRKDSSKMSLFHS
jgi:predicted amidohydrolase